MVTSKVIPILIGVESQTVHTSPSTRGQEGLSRLVVMLSWSFDIPKDFTSRICSYVIVFAIFKQVAHGTAADTYGIQSYD